MKKKKKSEEIFRIADVCVEFEKEIKHKRRTKNKSINFCNRNVLG